MMTRFIFTALLFLSLSCTAQDKIDTDRPDQTESAFTVPRGYFQAEFGFNKENGLGKNYTLVHPTALFKYGLGRTELRLESTVSSQFEHLIPDPKWAHGLEPVEIGFKTAIWEEKKMRPKLSLIMHTSVPFLASGVYKENKLAPAFRFCMQHTTGKSSALGINLGAEWDGQNSRPHWLYTIAQGFDLSEKWYLYVEAFGFITVNSLPEHSLDAGLAYYISNDLKVDISAGKGISAAAPDSYAAIGFSFRLRQ